MSKRLSALVVASAAVIVTVYVLSNRGGEDTPMELPVVDASVDYGLEIDVAGQANGTIVIDLFEDLAPLHVAQITSIAQDGGYDGVVFHRVIDGFMAQTRSA